MTAEVYFADPEDLTYETKLFDLQQFWSDDHGFKVLRIESGGVASEIEWLHNPAIAGATQASRGHFEASSTFFLMADYSAVIFDDLAEDYRALAQLLDSEAILAIRPRPESELFLLDTYPSPVASVFRGQEAAGYWLTERLVDPSGYPVQIFHHPYARRIPVPLIEAQPITNAVNDSAFIVTNPGSADSEARIEITIPSSSANVVQARIGIRSQGDLSEFAGDFEGFSITPEASPNAYWTLLWRQVLTPTELSALTGTFRVYATLEMDADVYDLQLFSGWLDMSPLPASGPVVTLDTTDVPASHETEVNLGEVRLEQGSTALVLECWGKAEASGGITWGQATLIPADEQIITASVPGFRGGRFWRRVWHGDELDESLTNDVTDDGVMILEEQNDTGTIPPAGGVALPEGRHVFDLRGHVRNRDRTRAKVGEFQALENGSVVKQKSLRSKKGQPRTSFGDDDGEIPARIQVDADGSALWTARANYTETTDNGREIRVAAIRAWFIPVLSSGAKMVIDAAAREAYVTDSDGFRKWPLLVDSFPILKAGDSAIVVRLLDAPAQGYDDVDWREPLGKVVSSRDGLASVTVVPRELLVL